MPEQMQPTPREMEILKVLWDTGPANVRDVYRRLAEQQDEDLAYNTVQTLLRIMEEKGLVAHAVEGRAFIYRPLFTRENSLSGYVERVFDGAADQLVLTLLKTEQLSTKELDRLHGLIETARKQKKQ